MYDPSLDQLIHFDSASFAGTEVSGFSVELDDHDNTINNEPHLYGWVVPQPTRETYDHTDVGPSRLAAMEATMGGIMSTYHTD